jgi:hypothetical protein
VTEHPNAIAGGSIGITTVLLIFLADRYGVVNVGPVEGAAGATVLISAGLLLGKKGVRGIARMLWRGSE